MELFFTMGLLRRIRDTDTARDLFSDYLQISEDFVLILRLCLLIFTYNFANGLTVKRPPHAKFKMLWEDLFLTNNVWYLKLAAASCNQFTVHGYLHLPLPIYEDKHS
jgi:hypothetical protein